MRQSLVCRFVQSHVCFRTLKPDIGSSLWTAPIQKIGSLCVKSPVPNVKLPQGLWYVPDVLSLAQESRILQTINETPFDESSIRRRLQFHGEVTMAHQSHPHIHIHTLHARHPSSQLLVNEYLGNTGLSCHLEDPLAFGHYIYTISLINPVWMDLKPILNDSDTSNTNTIPKQRSENTVDGVNPLLPMRILLEPRSVLILAGNARYRWMHGITKTKSVQLPGGMESVPRDEGYRRISLTLRYLREGRKKVQCDSFDWVS
ncbi:hypothetical protein BCR33DRAFT_717747 [Rhizoclosmatium globosum]|uniref:Alpha-ketoglutarate-dependent dioxygenase AlkB-like domain-containing protein n=1 Tax=Rhizoclosmatium globosum TaxID=329046 RepID=A0A1Y2C7L5_9FUNG|nr:hypothetical protein BCR33DRAFT_717747 [Rhizoclosmatium globosum]|eukprot:ORY43020.1 hypothetical protein BCR33DRAFT_717747 [Rhizoclosmatium globosum]